MAELSRAESWNWIYTEASFLLQKIQSLYENGAEAVTQGKIEYETKPIRRGITASPDLISKQIKERIYETLRKSSANQRK